MWRTGSQPDKYQWLLLQGGYDTRHTRLAIPLVLVLLLVLVLVLLLVLVLELVLVLVLVLLLRNSPQSQHLSAPRLQLRQCSRTWLIAWLR